MSRTTLATALADWTDIDVAAHALARCLGLVPHHSVMSDAKPVYWSNNPLGDISDDSPLRALVRDPDGNKVELTSEPEVE